MPWILLLTYVTQVQSNVLSMLTRMRQLALHPGLVPSNYLEQLRQGIENDKAAHESSAITPGNRVHLQGILAQAIEDSEECPICFSELDHPMITGCAHIYCLPWLVCSQLETINVIDFFNASISEVIARDPKCPMVGTSGPSRHILSNTFLQDRRPIAMSDLVEPAPPIEFTQPCTHKLGEEEDAAGIRAGPSDKINQLVHLLKLLPGTDKSLVFSQFTSFLYKIGEALEAEGSVICYLYVLLPYSLESRISHVRFDGQMTAKRRQETLERFCVPLSEADTNHVTPQLDTSALDIPERRSRIRQNVSRDSSMMAGELFDEGTRDGDSDFVASGGDDASDDVLSDDMRASVRKGKGKSLAKGKEKLSAKSTPNVSGNVNPKVRRCLASYNIGTNDISLGYAYLVESWSPRLEPHRGQQCISDGPVRSPFRLMSL
jgi:SWI/SNF-related matrix-associated actin-dependent regulator of chromatin subfamily A3